MGALQKLQSETPIGRPFGILALFVLSFVAAGVFEIVCVLLAYRAGLYDALAHRMFFVSALPGLTLIGTFIAYWLGNRLIASERKAAQEHERTYRPRIELHNLTRSRRAASNWKIHPYQRLLDWLAVFSFIILSFAGAAFSGAQVNPENAISVFDILCVESVVILVFALACGFITIQLARNKWSPYWDRTLEKIDLKIAQLEAQIDLDPQKSAPARAGS